MPYRVSFTRRAARDMESLFGSINAENSPAALRWYTGLQQTIRLLATQPRMGAVTRVSPSRRQLIYGNKPHFYRVIYQVDDERQTVTVVQIRHGKQAPPERTSL